MTAMGVEGYDVMATSMNFEAFKAAIKAESNTYRQRDGRYYVVLSLVEAEHLRSVLHLRKDRSSVLPSESTKGVGEAITNVKLWSLTDFEMTLFGSFSKGSNSAKSNTLSAKAQHLVMTNSYRFMNSDTHYTDAALVVLLRILQAAPLEDRMTWWSDIRACRRRNQAPWDGSIPVGTIFNTKDEFSFLEFKAVVERIKLGLVERGMLIFDAFRAFNSSNTGVITCSELYGAIEWLGISFTPDQVYDLVRKVAVGNEGLISYVDFKRVFQLSDEEFESRGGNTDTYGSILPKPIPELVEFSKDVSNLLFLQPSNFPCLTQLCCYNYYRLRSMRKFS